MQTYILGSGTPTSDAERFGSSYVFHVGDDYIMVDCGPATTYKLAKLGIKPTMIDHLLFTHHHFDHDVDYPCFLLSRWNESVGVENELQVLGPTLTELISYRLMDADIGAFAHDWIARINHPLSLNAHTSRGGSLPRPPLIVNARDVGPGKVHAGDTWEITAAPAEHVEPWLDSLAYRLDTEEGSIVVTGDTRPCQSVEELAKDVDLMLCLCTYLQDEIDGTPESEFMCGSTAAAQMAQAAGAKQLALVHQSPSLDQPGLAERALADITAVYDGTVIWGRELMTLEM